MKKKRAKSKHGHWIVVTYWRGRITWVRWCRTWAGVQMSKRNAESYNKVLPDSEKHRVIVMDIERMAAFAITEAADEIHDLYRLFEK